MSDEFPTRDVGGLGLMVIPLYGGRGRLVIRDGKNTHSDAW